MSPFGSSLDHFRELLEVTGVRFLPNLRVEGVHAFGCDFGWIFEVF